MRILNLPWPPQLFYSVVKTIGIYQSIGVGIGVGIGIGVAVDSGVGIGDSRCDSAPRASVPRATTSSKTTVKMSSFFVFIDRLFLPAPVFPAP